MKRLGNVSLNVSEKFDPNVISSAAKAGSEDELLFAIEATLFSHQKLIIMVFK